MEGGTSLTPLITLCAMLVLPFSLSVYPTLKCQCGIGTSMTFVCSSDSAHVAKLYTEKAALQNVENFLAQISLKH